METINLPYLLLNTRGFIIEQIQVEENELCLTLESLAVQGTCPKCDQESGQLHSTYLRYPRDLPWAEWPVRLHWRTKRFFCGNPKCPKKTFAERFPDFLARYARRTDRVRQKQQRLGVNVCARMAEKLLTLDQVGISDTTVNRLLLDLPEPEPTTIRVRGVDDWAKRKGQRYGTILVDLERGQVIDLLEERTAEPLVKWLEGHPGIEIVSRDRSQVYGDAIRRGASEAIQVADRWHLLKNGSDALYNILQQEYSVIRTYLEPKTDAHAVTTSPLQPKEAEETFTTAEQHRQERMDRAKQLHVLGCSQKQIAQQLDLHPKSIRRYLRSSSARARRSRTRRLTDPFQPYLLQRWNEGCHNAMQLFREIQEQGYVGRTTMVRTVIQGFRAASGLPPRIRTSKAEPLATDPTRRPPTLRALTFAVTGRPENCTEEHQDLLERICAEQPVVGEVITQAGTFATLIREQQAEKLQDWLECSHTSSYRIWKNFAAGIEQDRQAVEAALTHHWSNGPTEGHINRLKYLKRLMYGRAKDNLLRKRVLWQGKWGFT